jgi:diketogulonate reductase-like aldo/keto reductase
VLERRLGPVIGVGTYATFRQDRDLAARVVAAAFDAGCRVFDSSPMYGGAEDSLAYALREHRDDAIIATKIWTRSEDEARSQLGAQLSWFGHIEVEQVHNLVAWQEHLPWLQAERDAGSIGRIGVTHYDPNAFDELERALTTRRFTAVQVPLNPRERECERRILPLAEELDIAVIVMRPFGGTGAPLVGPLGDNELEPLREVGIDTWPQALLAWVVADTRVDVVIPASSKAERVVENAAAGARELPAELRDYVAQLALR